MLEWIDSYFDCKDHFMNTVYSVSASLASCCHSMFCVYDEWLVDFRTLKKKSHIISKSFIQMHPFMLSSLKVPRWIWKLLLFRFTGFSELKNQYWSRAEGGVLQQVKAFLSCALFMKVLTLLHWTHIHMFLEHGIVILNKRINMWLKSRLSAFI